MLMSIIISGLVGLALGMQFRVWILVPVLPLAAAGAIAGSIALPIIFSSVATEAITVVAAIQVGYLVGGLLLRAGILWVGDGGARSHHLLNRHL